MYKTAVYRLINGGITYKKKIPEGAITRHYIDI